MMDMRQKLEELGLREEYNEPITLHSGLKSRIKWDIEKLFQRPRLVRLEALHPFIQVIYELSPARIVGIPTGGALLANALIEQVGGGGIGCSILMDDVMTTGQSIREALEGMERPDYIAVLVNRSGLDEIEGIPVISGIKADLVQ